MRKTPVYLEMQGKAPVEKENKEVREGGGRMCCPCPSAGGRECYAPRLNTGLVRSGKAPLALGPALCWVSQEVVLLGALAWFDVSLFSILSATLSQYYPRQSKKTGVATFDHNQLLSGVSVCCMYVLLRN